MRRKLAPLAYVELGPDNGGILLNLGEGGFAVQSALALQTTEFPELRFQVPQVGGWLNAGGRIAWLSENKRVAGIQFLELPESARLEIRKWISAKESGEPLVDERRGGTEPGTMTPGETAYRADSRAQLAKDAAFRPEAQPRPAVPQGTGASSAAVSNVSTEAQDFRFNDYSMFAPSREEIWVEPAQKRAGSRRTALLVILLAALFFVLGATVGRSTVDNWIAYIAARRQGPNAPSDKPTAPVDDAKRAAPDTKETEQGQEPTPGGAQAAEAQQTPAGIPKTEQNGAESAPADGGRVDNKISETVAPETTSTRPSEKNDEAAGLRGGVTPLAPRRPTKSVVAGNETGAGETGSGPVWEHSILVTAPEPGSPPFQVNLPGEAVSASRSVAISARRTMLVPPRGGPGYAQSERVVIGRLLSHGEPFYPAEARSKHVEGGVEVRATIGRTGQVIAVRPVSGPALLASAAMTAIREWRYEPTFLNGDPVETQAEITMVFRLP